MIKIEVHSTRAAIRYQEPLTVGLRGAKVRFSFGAPWEGLTKTAVFRQGEKTVTVADVGLEATIPWEVLTVAGMPVQIGISGIDSTGAVAIPTVWTKTTAVCPGADPEGDPSTEPTPGLWEQLQGKMGSLEQLDTTDQSSLVEAINEANRAVCLVTVTDNGDGTYRANKTPEELEEAWISGKTLICRWPDIEIYLPLTLKSGDEFNFVATAQNTEYRVKVDRYGTTCSTIVLVTDQGKLPNPNKLIFTGAVETEYDGSNETQVQIPSKISQLENDSGYLTQAPVTSVNGKTGDVVLPTVVKVTVTKQSDGSYEPNLSCAEIMAAYSSGNTVYCQCGARVLPMVIASNMLCAFSGVYSGNVHSVVVFVNEKKAKVETIPMDSGSSGDGSYILPIATPDTLGGVKPVAKTDDMTQPVGADELGGLWTAPGSGGSNGGFNDNPLELINEITLDQETFLVEITKDANGEPFELEDFYFQVDALTTADGSSMVNGHLTINDVFMQNIESGWGKDVTNMNYTHTLHYFNAGQVVFFTRRDGSSQWTYTKTSVKMINLPITKVQINLSVSSIHYQVGASFKLYGRRVKK